MNEAFREVVVGRHNALVDPSLHIWGWEIPVYLFLGGLTAGILVVSAILALRRPPGSPPSRALQVAPFLALGLLSLGMLALFLDLEHKSHVFRFYLAFKPASPMSWGSWILILVYPLGVLHGLGSLDAGIRSALLASRPVRWLRLAGPLRCLSGRADAMARSVAWVVAVAGAGLGVYTGVLLGTLAAEPLWNSPVLGPLFLASGVSTGAAFLLLLPLSKDERHLVAGWDLVAIAVEAGLLAALLIGFATGSGPDHAALDVLVSGPQASAFWTLVVLAGLAAPFALEVLERRRGLAFLKVTPVLVLAGGFALRWILVAAGQASSLANVF